jgi:hypothetical protein
LSGPLPFVAAKGRRRAKSALWFSPISSTRQAIPSSRRRTRFWWVAFVALLGGFCVPAVQLKYTFTGQIAIHDTALGPAFGGCRMYPYASELFGWIRLDPVLARLAPHDQAHAGRNSVAKAQFQLAPDKRTNRRWPSSLVGRSE